MCHSAVGLISNALHEVDNAESLLKIKNLVTLFMQAMDVRNFHFKDFNSIADIY